jgi:hypothetical protein
MINSIKKNTDYIVVLALSILAGYFVYSAYHFAKDDLCNVHNFYVMLKQRGLIESIRALSTNEWIGYFPRSFFMTWVIQTFLVKLFGLNDLFSAEKPFAIFISFIQLLTALMIISIGRKIGLSTFARVVIASFYLLSPASFVDTAISNNWFFILPFFFLCSFIWYLSALNHQIKSLPQSLIVFILIMLIIFSGEQLILCPFAYLACLIFDDIRKQGIKKSIPKRLYEIALILISFGIFYYYITSYSKSPTPFSAASPWSTSIFEIGSLINFDIIPKLARYSLSMVKLGLKFFNFKSWLYAENTIPYNLALGGISFVCAYMSIWVTDSKESIKKNNYSKAIFMAWLMLLSIMMPLFFACITGSRPGPEERYIAIPAFILFFILMTKLLKSNQSTQWKRIIVSLFIGYCALLIAHLSIDIFKMQEKIDEKIYQIIINNIDNKTRYLVTTNNDQTNSHRGLVRPYLSGAWTDFQADWGFSARFTYMFNRPITLINNISIRNKKIIGIGYWGQEYEINEEITKVIYLNDGPLLSSIGDPKIEILTLHELINLCKKGDQNFKKVCSI